MRTIKLFFFLALVFFFCANLHAQVTIGGLEEPKAGAILDLNSTAKGGLILSNVPIEDLGKIPTGIDRFPGIVANTNDEINPDFKGAIVYNTNSQWGVGVYLWNGTNWTPLGEDCRALTSADLILSPSSIIETTVGTAITFSVSSCLSARCSEGEEYIWSVSPTTNVSFSSNGSIATASFSSANEYTVTVEAKNRYMSASLQETFSVYVGVPLPTDNNYYLIAADKPCFDVKGPVGNYNIIDYDNSIIRKNDFIGGNFTKGFKFHYDGDYHDLQILNPGGIVASVTQPTNLSASGSGDAPFTVTFKSGVRDSVLTKGTPITVQLVARYKIDNNDKVATINVPVMDDACCPVRISTSPEKWLTFACHNLGGRDIVDYDGSNVNGSGAMNYTYHGDWYRFGVNNASLINTGNNNDAITDWTMNSTLAFPFQTGNDDWFPENNPCPAGWRLPTVDEWRLVISVDANNQLTTPPNNAFETLGGVWSEGPDKFSAVKKIGDYLYLPAAGYRSYDDGLLKSRGSNGYYYSRSHGTQNSVGFRMGFYSSGQNIGQDNRASGYTVRCVVAL
jgi:uncharacterized protein (TIGR02145 family)